MHEDPTVGVASLQDSDLGGLRDAFVEALLRSDPREARRLVADSPARARDLYLEVLAPALYEIGDRWERAEISVAQEHLATAITESVMAELAPRLTDDRDPPARGRAVVACSDGELHRVGARMVGDFLEADGWDVLFLGALTPPEHLVALVSEQRAAVVAISASLPDRIDELAEVCAVLGRLQPRPVIAVGGRAFRAVGAEAVERLGADLFLGDPSALPGELGRRFPEVSS